MEQGLEMMLVVVGLIAVSEAEQGSQVQSVFIRCCAAFKSPDSLWPYNYPVWTVVSS